MRRLGLLVAALVSAASCSIICGTGCDLAIPGECHGAGGMYGRCVENGCADGLECFTGLAGDICVPVVADGPPPDEALKCASTVGDLDVECIPQAYGACLVRCENDSQCHIGTVCEEIIGACMYPHNEFDVRPPPGAELGQCDMNGECGYHLDECLVASDGVGTICARPDHPEWLVPCSAVDQDCPNGQVCSIQDFTCVWPDYP